MPARLTIGRRMVDDPRPVAAPMRAYARLGCLRLSHAGRGARHTAFTLVELLVVIAVVGILLCVLAPTVYSVRDQAYDTKCKAHLHKICQILHAGENLSVTFWMSAVRDCGGGEILKCPKDTVDPLLTTPGGYYVTGNVQEIPPPPSVTLGATEDSKWIRTFGERDGCVLPSGVKVDGVGPGTYTGGSHTTGTVAAGTMVSSTYLFFDPVGNGPADTCGQITFSSDILGVIFISGTLDQSDPVLGHPGTVYPTGLSARGFEPDHMIKIENDNRTIVMDHWHTTGAQENVRVITKPGGGPSSYGMNSQVRQKLYRLDQLLLVEYKKCSADRDGVGADDDLGVWLAPRHNGRANAALVNGSVISFDPDELGPDAKVNVWKP